MEAGCYHASARRVSRRKKAVCDPGLPPSPPTRAAAVAEQLVASRPIFRSRSASPVGTTSKPGCRPSRDSGCAFGLNPIYAPGYNYVMLIGIGFALELIVAGAALRVARNHGS